MTQGAVKLLTGKKELGKDIWKVYNTQGLVMTAKTIGFDEAKKNNPDMFGEKAIANLRGECAIDYLENEYKIKNFFSYKIFS